jgi:hypothetical protein
MDKRFLTSLSWKATAAIAAVILGAGAAGATTFVPSLISDSDAPVLAPADTTTTVVEGDTTVADDTTDTTVADDTTDTTLADDTTSTTVDEADDDASDAQHERHCNDGHGSDGEKNPHCIALAAQDDSAGDSAGDGAPAPESSTDAGESEHGNGHGNGNGGNGGGRGRGK